MTVEITADAQDMASWDSTSEEMQQVQKEIGSWVEEIIILVGNGSHEAVNNVLAAQGMTQANGMTDAGNAENVKRWTLAALDFKETFGIFEQWNSSRKSTSGYGSELLYAGYGDLLIKK